MDNTEKTETGVAGNGGLPRRSTLGEVGELSLQTERSSVHTQASLIHAFTRIHNAEAVLNELLEALAESGVIHPEQVPLAIKRFGGHADSQPEMGSDDLGSRPPMDPESAEEEQSKLALRWPGVVLRTEHDDGPPLEKVDCAARMHLCHAVCCSLQFPLSADEVDAGKVKWDLGHPYMIRDNSDGYCFHNEADTGHCTVYDDRPGVCRRYSCAHDKRIWSDFEGMVLNTEWISEHLGHGRKMRVHVSPDDGGGGE